MNYEKNKENYVKTFWSFSPLRRI